MLYIIYIFNNIDIFYIFVFYNWMCWKENSFFAFLSRILVKFHVNWRLWIRVALSWWCWKKKSKNLRSRCLTHPAIHRDWESRFTEAGFTRNWNARFVFSLRPHGFIQSLYTIYLNYVTDGPHAWVIISWTSSVGATTKRPGDGALITTPLVSVLIAGRH